MFRKVMWMLVLASASCVPCIEAQSRKAQRESVSLNGLWDVEDSETAEAPPPTYAHTVPVPGLVHSSTPAFSGVDEYQSRELLLNLMHQGRLKESEYTELGDARGRTSQTRRYFWYHRTFTAPARRSVAILRVAKAQFGIEVFVNGKSVGSHFPCFSASVFDVSAAIHWSAVNEVVIRVGAHPGMLPSNVLAGTDFEKNRWTPGIYDDVELQAMDNPVVTNVQVVPDLPHSGVTVQTELKNFSQSNVTTKLTQQVARHKSLDFIGRRVSETVSLIAGETKTVRQFVPISQAHLWTPDDPYLYDVTSRTSGDEARSYFGMREFRFDTPTRRAYLNGKPFFLRGSNITLHRFFEDPESGQLPWTDAWVHRLLVEIPKQLHWNSFRFCIGPVPDKWLQIADENGLLIQNEYLVWTGPGGDRFYHPKYDSKEMIGEYTEWMRDNWNHPSVAIWDASNESILPQFTDEIIPAIRGLDLSDRPWENGYNAPAGPNDPVEDHQYFLHYPGFKMEDVEFMVGPMSMRSTAKSGHANILNEYGWVWLNRDGTPTLLTEKLYPQLLKDKDSTESRFHLQEYLLQAETEFWRAYRHYAGVLHFVYLTTSDPRAFTADHFQSVKELKLRPSFEHAMEQAFNPLGVYLNFWQPTLKAGYAHPFTICLVNDLDRKRTGTLTVTIADASGVIVQQSRKIELDPIGAQSYDLTVDVPKQKGAAQVDAKVVPDDDPNHAIVSHRETVLN